MQEATPQRIWETALGQLQLQVTRPNYETFLKETTGLALHDSTFVVGTRNDFVTAWLSTKLQPLITKTLSRLLHKQIHVTFKVIGANNNICPSSGALSSPHSTSAPAATLLPTPRLNDKYTFERFVVGRGSRLAHAAALAVAEHPGKVYNPLCICATAGLGKTHLLQAIAHHTASLNGHKLLYVTSEHFTNEFLHAIASGRTPELRHNYRNLDILLIDDIQFLAGKERTQEEFFYTFNELHARGAQIVTCSDRLPSRIVALDARLRSRLEWGLIADIEPPDLQTRLAILQGKAQQQGCTLPEDVLLLLAETARENVRQLEGYLNRVIAYAKLTRAHITHELAAQALAAFSSPTPSPTPEPQAVLHAVSAYFNIPADALRGTARTKAVAEARHIAMYLLREHCQQQLKQIGHLFGNRDHSTVVHACKKIVTLCSLDPRLAKQIGEIRALLKR